VSQWFGFRQRSLHGGWRRLRRALSARVGLLPRSQRVFVVEIAGRPYKRVVFADSFEAQRAARALALFGPQEIYPRVILLRERELLLEFVEGRALSEIPRVEGAVLEGLADVLAALYRRDARELPLGETPFAHALATDLRFLAEVGVLAADARRRLEEVAAREAPRRVWVGWDCSDAILKNFVLEPSGRVRCVDAESLCGEQLLGSGVAKAALRWLGPRRELFLDLLAKRSVPDFRAYLPFVELCFTAFWLKSSFLERKRRFVDPRLFERFLAP
jgi:hypothetical protein